MVCFLPYDAVSYFWWGRLLGVRGLESAARRPDGDFGGGLVGVGGEGRRDKILQINCGFILCDRGLRYINQKGIWFSGIMLL